MMERISAAQAKSHFSEILSRVFYAHDQFLIERKGKPVAVLVDVSSVDLKSSGSGAKRGLIKAAGAWKEYRGLERTVSRIYSLRKRSRDRDVTLD